MILTPLFRSLDLQRTVRLSFAPAFFCLLFATSWAAAEDALNKATPSPQAQSVGAPFLQHPIWVYNDWSAYDELSDRIQLTEDLAMRELAEIARLKRFGVHFDYFVMDAFWFAPDGAYREWRKPSWPNGPDRWIAECHRQGLLPGLWFGTNALVKINAAPAWRDSLNKTKGAMAFSEGGFLPDFMKAMEYWYGRGIRMFKFDFTDFTVATPQMEKTLSPEEIRTRNVTAFREALRKFREKHPDVVLVAFNGFGGDMGSTAGPFPFHDPVDLRWFDVFDTMYSGDPRPSDVPETNFWRSVDIYSDHMVRRYEQCSIPLERIDSTAFMIGNTGTIYYRKTSAWKGMLLLMVARGGWINTVHGNLEYLNDDDARWFAKVQSIYDSFQTHGKTKTFGGIPGEVEPYGFASSDARGAIFTVVNPAQRVAQLQLPVGTMVDSPKQKGRIIFRDAGFDPVLRGDAITLGPGQMAAVGYGRYADPKFDLGIQKDVIIPKSIEPLEAVFEPRGGNVIEAAVAAPLEGDVRIILQQRDANDKSIRRSWPGGPPDGTSMEKVLTLHASQGDKDLPLEINYNRLIWSGLSWAAGEIRHGSFDPHKPITVRCSSAEKEPMILEAKVYVVEY
jgi:hypothetical protein